MSKHNKKNTYKNKEEAKAKKQVLDKSEQREKKKHAQKAILNNWQDLMDED